MNIRLKLKKILIKMSSLGNNAKRRSFVLIALLLLSIINWLSKLSLFFKIMCQLIIALFFLDALGFSLFWFIEENVLQIFNEVFQRVFDEGKIRFVTGIIESIKLDEKNARHLQGLKISIDKQLNNQKKKIFKKL